MRKRSSVEYADFMQFNVVDNGGVLQFHWQTMAIGKFN
jgi:hypothetical protein